ncbi:MAG: hypothetical protein ABJA66_04735 [Actinomycetota bacterium]
MNRQICKVCGNEIINNSNDSMTFCTNCGSTLVNQFSAPNAQMTQVYPNKKTKEPLSGKEKFAMSALIAIPVVLILGTIGIVAFFIITIVSKMPPPRSNSRSYPSPNSSPGKTENFLLTFGSAGLGEGQFKNASALAVGKDGSIYVGDGTLRIQKFDASGKFVKLWNVTESITKADNKYTNRITNLAIDSKNTLYAVVAAGELLRYDGNTGKFIDKIAIYGDKWMNKQQEARVLDMFMQNDDKLTIFAASFPEGENIIVVSPDGKAEIKYKNLLRGQIKNPTVLTKGSLVVSVTGDIFLLNGYIMTDNIGYIYRFKADGSYVDRFTWNSASSLGIFSSSIALNSKGEIYANDSGKKQINVLSVEGVMLRSIPVGTDYIEKMVVDSNDNIFTLSRDKVEKYSSPASY